MKIKHLLETESSDKEYRKRAQEAYEKIYENLPDISMDQYSKVRVAGNHAFMIHSSKLNIDDDFDIVISSPPQQNPNAVGGYDVNTDRLFLFVNMSKPLDKQIQSKDVKQTVIHELIHKYDGERKSVNKPTSDLSLKDYYNSADEFNAYYQEGISEIETMIDRLIKLERKDVIEQSYYPFETFKERVLRSNFDSEFIRYINDTTKRKLTKRLYRYWNESVRPVVENSNENQ